MSLREQALAAETASGDRHGVPDSNVYLPGADAMADGTPAGNSPALGHAPEPEGRVIGQDPEAAERAQAAARAGARPYVVQVGGLRLTEQQYAMLLRPLDPRRIKTKQKQSHLEAWDVRRHLIRIFGFGGFSVKTISKEMIYRKETAPGEGRVTRWQSGQRVKVANDDWMFTVVYDCVVQLTVYGLDGTSAVYEDAATGDGANMPTFQQAADFAIKTAESQALKRCAVNLGDSFGLSLYNGGSADPVVNVTLIGPVTVHAGAVEQAAQSGEVHSEPEPVHEEEQPPVVDDGPTEEPPALPTALALRDEALERRTNLARLRAIFKMVHRSKGQHPELGSVRVINETGDDEPLDHLVHRQIEARKAEGETE
jgi:hypothetical protein